MQLTNIGKIVEKVVNQQSLTATEQLLLKENRGVAIQLKLLLNEKNRGASSRSPYFESVELEFLAASSGIDSFSFEYPPQKSRGSNAAPSFTVLFTQRQDKWFANWHFNVDEFYLNLCSKTDQFADAQGVICIYDNRTGIEISEISPDITTTSYEVECLSPIESYKHLSCGFK